MEGKGFHDLFSLPTFLFTIHIIICPHHFSSLALSNWWSAENKKKCHCYWHCSFYATKFAYNIDLVLPEMRQLSNKFLLQKQPRFFYNRHSNCKILQTEVSYFSLYHHSTRQTKSCFLREHSRPTFPWFSSRLLSHLLLVSWSHR